MAAQPAVVLHAGAHKTGTSLIQEYLRTRSRELRRMGIVDMDWTEARRVIGWGGVPRSKPELLRGAVQAALSEPYPLPRGRSVPRALAAITPKPRTVIVSYENSLGPPFRPPSGELYPIAAVCALGLADNLAQWQPRVVYYIRSQEEYLESYYLQTIHEGGAQAFNTWLETIDQSALSWVPVVEALTAAFGADRVIVKDFAQLRNGQNAFIDDFLRTCDPSINPTVSFDRLRNISISQRGLEIALAINPLLQTTEERRQARRFLQRYFNNTTAPRPSLLDEDTRAAIRERYAAENRELVATCQGLERSGRNGETTGAATQLARSASAGETSNREASHTGFDEDRAL